MTFSPEPGLLGRKLPPGQRSLSRAPAPLMQTCESVAAHGPLMLPRLLPGQWAQGAFNTPKASKRGQAGQGLWDPPLPSQAVSKAGRLGRDFSGPSQRRGCQEQKENLRIRPERAPSPATGHGECTLHTGGQSKADSQEGSSPQGQEACRLGVPPCPLARTQAPPPGPSAPRPPPPFPNAWHPAPPLLGTEEDHIPFWADLGPTPLASLYTQRLSLIGETARQKKWSKATGSPVPSLSRR